MILSKQIASLFRLVECGSFSKAAQQLFISPSALVQQINLLEEEVGVPLVKRSWKGIELTEAGAVFCEKMTGVVSEIEEAKRLAQEAGASQEIRIAYAQNLQEQNIYGIYRLYNTLHPGKMRITPIDYSRLIEAVKNNTYDACYIQTGRMVRESGLLMTPLTEEKPSLALPLNHPLASRKTIRLSDLADTEIVLPEYGLHDSADVFSDELETLKIPVRIRRITDLIESEIYCREHCAARLCLRRVLDPNMISVPVETSAMFGICLAYQNDPVILQRLKSLISLTQEYQKGS